MKPVRLILLAAILTLSGCATGTGTHWYAPATWFSHSAADKVDRVMDDRENAKAFARAAARDLAHKTQMALAEAPASRPVEVAQAANDDAVALLDQTEGAPDAKELAKLRTRVRELVSDNAALRAHGEAQDKVDRGTIDTLSTNLTKAEAKVEKANDGLRSAFDRENALANELRTERAIKWILGSVAFLALAGWLYVRFFLGGVPNAVGGLLARLETRNPQAATDARSILDDLLHSKPSAQAAIAAAYSKAR